MFVAGNVVVYPPVKKRSMVAVKRMWHVVAVWATPILAFGAAPPSAHLGAGGAGFTPTQYGRTQPVCEELERDYVVKESQRNSRVLNFFLFEAAERGCMRFVEQLLAEGPRSGRATDSATRRCCAPCCVQMTSKWTPTKAFRAASGFGAISFVRRCCCTPITRSAPERRWTDSSTRGTISIPWAWTKGSHAAKCE